MAAALRAGGKISAVTAAAAALSDARLVVTAVTGARPESPRAVQFFGKPIEAAGKAVDIEIQRIVMAVGNFGVDGGMERGNEPFARRTLAIV